MDLFNEERGAAEKRYQDLHDSFVKYKKDADFQRESASRKERLLQEEIVRLRGLNSQMQLVNEERQQLVERLTEDVTSLQERESDLQAKLLASEYKRKLSNAELGRMVSDLAQFGLSYQGPDSLCLGEKWVNLLKLSATIGLSSGAAPLSLQGLEERELHFSHQQLHYVLDNLSSRLLAPPHHCPCIMCQSRPVQEQQPATYPDSSHQPDHPYRPRPPPSAPRYHEDSYPYVPGNPPIMNQEYTGYSEGQQLQGVNRYP
ncbi:hypothetical protein CPC08DRAFT_704074 [Agrocybe pediades]|nr:hypothetical protein CPC08DRAFT_704074 [Agrocybe pediades]